MDPKKEKENISTKLNSGLSSSLSDLLCVSVWMGPPIHRLAAKLEDLSASLSLTSSSTRCRSLDASDWDSSSKSPARFREILSLSNTATARSISLNSHQVGYDEKVCGRSTPFWWITKGAIRPFTSLACKLFNKWRSSGFTTCRLKCCIGVSLQYLYIWTYDVTVGALILIIYLVPLQKCKQNTVSHSRFYTLQ